MFQLVRNEFPLVFGRILNCSGEAVEAEEETGAVGDAPAPHSEFHLKPADNHLINRTKKGLGFLFIFS